MIAASVTVLAIGDARDLSSERLGLLSSALPPPPLRPQQEQQERARRHAIFVAEGKANRVFAPGRDGGLPCAIFPTRRAVGRRWSGGARC
jgi:hypothetical protein